MYIFYLYLTRVCQHARVNNRLKNFTCLIVAIKRNPVKAYICVCTNYTYNICVI